MRINYIFCPQCFQELGMPGYFTSIELNNDAVWKLSCPSGHNTQIILQNPKFEILFHMGTLQFLERNWRSSVQDFIAALETFLQYFIEIIYFDFNLENCVELVGKDLNRQWERLYGAFLATHPIKFKEHKKIPKQQIEFRNKIIHGNYIPSENEAYNYCKFVYDFITSIKNKLNKEISEETRNKFTVMTLEKKHRLFPSSLASSVFPLLTMLHTSEANLSFLERFKTLEKMKEFLHTNSTIPKKWTDFRNMIATDKH